MNKAVFLLAAALMLFPSVAIAQEVSPPATDVPVAEAEKPAPAAPKAKKKAAPKMTKAQRLQQEEQEKVVTDFFNNFGGMGWAEVKSVTKVDNRYHIRILTTRGHTAFVEIDPVTGKILTMGPDTVANASSTSTDPASHAPWPMTNWNNYSTATTPSTPDGSPQHLTTDPAQLLPRTLNTAGCVSNWKELNNALNALDRDRELPARRMALDVWDLHASGVMDDCMQLRQKLDSYIRGN